MTPDERRRQEQMLDSIYGAPSLKEQGYFGQGGRPMGPPTEAMEMQMHPFGREEDAFRHDMPPQEKMWFVDQIDGPDAVLMRDDKVVTVPAETLPKGAKEGLFFDPQSGRFSPGESKGDRMRSQRAVDVGEDGLVYPHRDEEDLGG